MKIYLKYIVHCCLILFYIVSHSTLLSAQQKLTSSYNSPNSERSFALTYTNVFYNSQSNYSIKWNQMLLQRQDNALGKVIYKEYFEYFGPFKWIEQCMGIGCMTNLFHSFFTTKESGIVFSMMLGMEPQLPATRNKVEWEFGFLVSLGIGCTF